MDERLNRSEWMVAPIPASVCKQLIEQYHYSKSTSKVGVYRHGLFRRSAPDVCLGAAQWLPPTKTAAQSSWDGDRHHVLCLSRLVIHPDVPKNAASFLIARSIKLIAADGRFRCLVTYADSWQGHTGAIYKATNWEYMGATLPEDRWIDPQTNRLVSRYRNQVGRPRTLMPKLGYVRAGKYVTHKYRIILPEPRPRAASLVS